MAIVRDSVNFEIQDGTDFIFKSNTPDETLTTAFEGFSTRTVVPAGAVDLQITFNGPTNVKRLYFVADEALIIKIITPGFDVLSAQPLTMVEGVANFLAVSDISQVFVSNPGIEDVVLKLGAAGDDTIPPVTPAPVTINNDVIINGKLTVSGLIDPPLGVQLEPQNAGEITALPESCYFVDDADNNPKFKKVGGTIIDLSAGGGGGVSSVSATAPVLSSGGSTPVISMPQANGSTDGYLSGADYGAFDAKVQSVSGSAPIQSTLGVDPIISIPKADSTTDGYLDNIDWVTFNNKQAPGSYITQLTGDVTGFGPGAAAATVVQVGGQAAAGIATASIDVAAASSVNDPSTIVRRDGSNRFEAADPINPLEVANRQFVLANAGGTGDFKADGSVPMTGTLQMNDQVLSLPHAVYVGAGSNALYGGTDANESKVQVVVSAPTVDPARGHVGLYSSEAQAGGIGPILTFGGKYTTAGAITFFGSIQFAKVDSGDGDFSADCIFNVRVAGEVLRLKSDGTAVFLSTVSGADPVLPAEFATKNYVDTLPIGDFLADGSVPMTGNLDGGNNRGINFADPNDGQDLATMNYVDVIAGDTANSPGLLVRRDGNGDFAARDINLRNPIATGRLTVGDGIISSNNQLLLQTSGQNANIDMGDLSINLNPDPGAGAVNIQGTLDMTTNPINNVTVVSAQAIKIAEGASRMGIATMVGGTVTVSNTVVTANSRIFLTTQNPGGTPGAVYISARTPGVSFVITSTSGADTSDVAWMIVEPA